MRLSSLRAQNVRLIESASLIPSPAFNLVTGENGSGKSSLLECIHILGTGRSFRTRHVGDVIAHGASDLVVFGEVLSGEAVRETVGVEKSRSRTRIRVAEQEVHASSVLARILPVLLIGPDGPRLVLEGAEHRRRLLDWALFHVEPSYLDAFARYARSLRQRNAQLKAGLDRRLLASWDEKVAAAGEALHRLRAERAPEIAAGMADLAGLLLGEPAELSYNPGWDDGTPLLEALRGSLERDLSRGYTGAGPHRADLVLAARGHPARTVLSRGEGKLVVAALQMALAVYVSRHGSRPPVLLVDDLGSELDEGGRGRLLEALTALPSQLFVTAVDPGSLAVPAGGKRFHVERGDVREMV